MFTGVLIVFSLLVIYIAACILPWWFIPVCIFAAFLQNTNRIKFSLPLALPLED